MKKIILTITTFISFSTAFYAVPCCSGTQSNESDSITLSPKNNTYVFSEQTNPTTGYNWYVTCTPDDVVDVQKKYTKNNSKSLAGGAVGVGGRTTFTITGKKTGNAQCTFESKRSWEKDKAAAKTLTITVTE